MRTETPEQRCEGTSQEVSRGGNVASATAKFLPACKAVFVENQLDFTKVPLEVIGNNHPR